MQQVTVLKLFLMSNSDFGYQFLVQNSDFGIQFFTVGTDVLCKPQDTEENLDSTERSRLEPGPKHLSLPRFWRQRRIRISKPVPEQATQLVRKRRQQRWQRRWRHGRCCLCELPPVGDAVKSISLLPQLQVLAVA